MFINFYLLMLTFIVLISFSLVTKVFFSFRFFFSSNRQKHFNFMVFTLLNHFVLEVFVYLIFCFCFSSIILVYFIEFYFVVFLFKERLMKLADFLFMKPKCKWLFCRDWHLKGAVSLLNCNLVQCYQFT